MSVRDMPPRIRWRSTPWWIALAFVAVAGLLFLYDPATVRFYPLCPLHALTGLSCPGCGATRSAHALLHGNFAEALRLNGLFVFGLPVVAAWMVWRMLGRVAEGTTPNRLLGRTVVAFVVLACVAFTVARNVSWRPGSHHPTNFGRQVLSVNSEDGNSGGRLQ